ncbi:hypothetical protein J2S46_000670 [Kitasatospora herbaricolor]|uniref:hypothetical protein n=1 Tax=Kitasatospora herbaricolor TaxID=68217 RepID=UPI0017487266|nr:hypothetical protein [Kitasatospora herbaricolor]MDQ0306114.1 hypothetical protein [Kitasatospora herbaricolor]
MASARRSPAWADSAVRRATAGSVVRSRIQLGGRTVFGPVYGIDARCVSVRSSRIDNVNRTSSSGSSASRQASASGTPGSPAASRRT